MSFYNKIVNDFASKKVSHDASLDYAKKRGLVLYIGHFTNGVNADEINRMVSFKGFVDSYKLGFAFETESQEAFYQDGPDLFPQSTKIEYQLTLQVPSSNKQEGIINIGKFEEFNRMVRGNTGNDRANYLLVSLANLIQNGRWTKKTTINTFSQLKQVGALAFVDKTNMTVDTEMGFWETEAGLVPKVFSINMQLHIIPQFINNASTPPAKIKDEDGQPKNVPYPNIIKYFKTDGSYNENDIELWPWGVTHSGMKL